MLPISVVCANAFVDVVANVAFVVAIFVAVCASNVSRPVVCTVAFASDDSECRRIFAAAI